jgi:hypothetical protein
MSEHEEMLSDILRRVRILEDRERQREIAEVKRRLEKLESSTRGSTSADLIKTERSVHGS